MANRPEQLCFIKKGKAMSAQENFADTFNWMASWIENIKGEADETAQEGEKKGVWIDDKVDDHPVIRSSGITVTDNQEAPVTASGRSISLASGKSSNLKFVVSNDDNGNIVIAIDVFYV